MPSEPVTVDELEREATTIARRIVSREVLPQSGAAAIWALLSEHASAERGGFHQFSEDVAVFVGLASEWRDDVEHRAEYEADIVEQAQRLVNRDGARAQSEP
jgi:hypothetical protein